MQLKRICIYISFLICCVCLGQKESVLLRLDSAIDSLTNNPVYSYKELLKIANNERHNDSVRARARLHLGSYFNSIGVVDSSMQYTRAALANLKRNKHLAKAYRILGSSYRRSGQIDSAIGMLHQSLKISEKYGYREITSKVKSDLGILYVNKQDFDKALLFFEESVESAANKQAVYGNYVNIGALYFYKGDLDNAEKYFKLAENLTPAEKDPKVSATIALNLGDVLFQKKQYREALSYYNRSKEIADKFGFKDKSLNATIYKARVIHVLGKPEAAIDSLKKSLVEAKKISSIEIQKKIYEHLSEIYTKTNDYKNALDATSNFHILKDSIVNNKQEKEITELEVKYETSQKEKQILVLKEDQFIKDAEIKRQRLLKRSFVTGFIIILIAIFAWLYVYYQKLQVKNKYNAQKEEIDKQKIASFLKEQELKLTNDYALAQNEERSRIARELHDSIGGNLAAIKMQMVDLQKDKEVPSSLIDQLDETYEQVRGISHDLIPKKISQTAFTNYISDYIKTIENVIDPEITFIPHPPEKINAIDDDKKVEIFKIIQELMTNALKHAKASVIEICLNAYTDSIEIIFEDDGVGFDGKKETNGIGLQNIQKRLSLLSAKMDIDSAINRGTAVRIQIPMTINELAD